MKILCKKIKKILQKIKYQSLSRHRQRDNTNQTKPNQTKDKHYEKDTCNLRNRRRIDELH